MSSPRVMTDDWLDGALTGCELLVAARGEVFPSLHDVPNEIASPAALRRLLSNGGYRLTQAAAQVVALRPHGGGIGAITAMMNAGRLVIVQRRVERPIAVSTVRRRRSFIPTPAPTVELATATSWIRFRVVHHATGAPFAGVRLMVRLPGGQEVRCRTNAFGMASVEEIEPGVCDVWCPLKDARLARTVAFVGLGAPAADSQASVDVLRSRSEEGAEWIAHVDDHRVQTGETILSIAEQNGYSWRELAEFNWGTSVPDQVNRHLRDDVGCTQKTRDGRNYQFTSEDEPGLIHIPRAWSESGLATEQTHVIRVRLAAGFRVILENEDGLRIPEADYACTLADGSERRGRLGRGGVSLIQDPPPGPVDVSYPDLDDVEAKSLAASVRRALDERQPLEVHRLFRYPTATIRRAFEAYDRYFNDYHGQGLRHDLRQEFFGDPEAELIFFGYMSELDSPDEPATDDTPETAPAAADEGSHA